MTFYRWLFAIVDPGAVRVAGVRPRMAARSGANWQGARSRSARIGIGTHNALAYLGLNYTTATNGVILNSFIP